MGRRSRRKGADDQLAPPHCAIQSQVFQHNDPRPHTGDNNDEGTGFDEFSSAMATSGVKSAAFSSTSPPGHERCRSDPGTMSKLSGIRIWEKPTLPEERRPLTSLLSSTI